MGILAQAKNQTHPSSFSSIQTLSRWDDASHTGECHLYWCSQLRSTLRDRPRNVLLTIWASLSLRWHLKLATTICKSMHSYFLGFFLLNYRKPVLKMSSFISDSYPGPTLSPLISQKGNIYAVWLEFLPLSLSTFLLYAHCKLSLKLISCCTIASSVVI